MKTLDWYNKLATIYDLRGDYPYYKVRDKVVEHLKLIEGETVFDFFCGSGVNFKYIINEIGEQGSIVGVDGSAKMLGKARELSEKLNFEKQVKLIQADFTSDADITDLKELIENLKPRKFLFTLGLTCIPNYSEFFCEIHTSAPVGSRFVIMDVYNDSYPLGAKFINWIGAADCTRPVWTELERHSKNFIKETLLPFKILGVSVVIASGEKN